MLVKHTDAVHWDDSIHAYSDRGMMMQQDRRVSDEFVPHYGYVSLFPFLLRLIPQGNRYTHVCMYACIGTCLYAACVYRYI